jgi:hypothetical protein
MSLGELSLASERSNVVKKGLYSFDVAAASQGWEREQKKSPRKKNDRNISSPTKV